MKRSSARIASLLALAALAIALSGCGSEKEKLTPGAKILSQAQLESTVATLGYPVYWLGPRDGTIYEYTHRSDGRVYIRYLAPGKTAGTQDRFLTVGTYPMPKAYIVVKKISQLPDAEPIEIKGGVGAQSQKKPESVYVAFKHKDLEIEVYSPDTGVAVDEAQSGDLQTIPTK